MFRIVFLAALTVTVYGASEVIFVHSPSSIQFKGHGQLDKSLLKEVSSGALGFTTNMGSDWDGMVVSHPFSYAEAVVNVHIDGIDSLEGVSGDRFPLYDDENEDETWRILRRRVRDRFPSYNNTLMRVELADGLNTVEPYNSVLGDIEIHPIPAHKALDLNETEDQEFLSQLNLFQEIIKKVDSGIVKRDGMPDLYWFVLPGLRSLVNFHGADSAQVQMAKELLSETILELSNAFVNAYNGHVLVSVVTSNDNHVRQTRSLKADEPQDDTKDLNLSKNYGADYPVIFNILLWFMVAFTFTILAVSVGIASMDPGRDSIIYRMTSNRMKKDN